MKSPLVDALRQANNGNGGKSLTDSGSFDTSSQEFTETANDALVYESPSTDKELALLEESASDADAATDAEIEPHTEHLETGFLAESDVLVTARTVPSPDSGSAPFIARFAPVLCLMLALAMAGSWSLYRVLQTRYTGFALVTEQLQNADARKADELHAVKSQFPFTELPAVAAEPPQ